MRVTGGKKGMALATEELVRFLSINPIKGGSL
jgi:hypothetical protein